MATEFKETKVCPVCSVEKPRSAFYCSAPTPRYPRGALGSRCKDCVRATRNYNYRSPKKKQSDAAYRARLTVEQRRERWLRTTFSISLAQYEDMLEQQNGRCAICLSEESNTKSGAWPVDHDHSCCPGKKSCGKCVRGLLCVRCNARVAALDQWSDDEMARAREYVQCRS